MGANDHTENFRRRVENHLPQEIPSDLAWDNMSSSLFSGIAQERKRRRRRRFFFWFSGSALIAIGISLLLWPPSNPIKEELVNKETISSTLDLAPKESHPSGNMPIESLPIAVAPKESRPSEIVKIYTKEPTDQTLTEEGRETPIQEDVDTFKGRGEKNILNSLFIPFISLPVEIPQPVLPKRMERSAPPPFNPYTRQIELLVYGGVNGFSSTYSPIPTLEEFPNLERQNKTGWQFGALVQKPLSATFRISAGLEVERLRYQLGLESEIPTVLFRPGTIDSIFINTRTGDSSFVFTDSIPGRRRLILENTFSTYSVKVPLSISRRFSFNRFLLDIRGGASFTLYSRNKGLLEDKETLLGEALFLPEQGLSLSLLGGALLSYPIREDLHLVGLVGIEKGIAEWGNNESSSFAQRPLVYHFNLGITKLLPQKTK